MKHLYSIIFLSISFLTFSQGRYKLDETFRIDAVGEFATSIVLKEQADGKVLVGGTFEIVEGSNHSYLTRLNADGSIDNTFNVDGTGPSNHVQDIEVLPDGKILVAMRQGLYYNGEVVSSIFRLNADGSLDESFDAGIFKYDFQRFNNSAFSIAIQSDGKIVVAGAFSMIGNNEASGIARLNSDGSFDLTFDVGAGLKASSVTEVAAAGSKVEILSDGSIAVIGPFDSYNGVSTNKIVIINPDGSLKESTNEVLESFFFPTIFDTEGFLVEQSDGKIVVAQNDNDTDLRLIRFNDDLTLDNTFNISISNERVNSLSRFSDDRLLIKSSNVNGIIDANGLEDVSIVFPNTVDKFYLIDDNTVFAEVENDEPGFTLEKYNATGEKQSFSAPRFYEVATVNQLVKETSGSYLFIGDMNFADGEGYSTTNRSIGRIAKNGQLDESFSPEVDGFINGIAIVGERIWIWGNFDSINETPISNIAKLNADGTLDNSFTTTGTGFDNRVEEVRFRTSGELIIVGDFETYNGVDASNIIQLNSDGSVDDSFNSGTGFDGARPEGLELLDDGKIIVYDGLITEYNGSATSRLVRINIDGSLDQSFNLGAGFTNSLSISSESFAEIVVQEAIKVLDNGKIIVAGEFDSFNGHNTIGLARLNSDGSVDTQFVSEVIQKDNFYGAIRNIEINDSGDLLIAGIFETIDGNDARLFARLDSLGGFVESFDLERDIQGFAQQVFITDDTLYLSGRIKSIGGNTYSGLVRFFYEKEEALNIDQTNDIYVYPNPVTYRLRLSDESIVKEYSLFNTAGQLVELNQQNPGSDIDVSHLTSGSYLIRLVTKESNEDINIRFIKK